MSLAKKILCAAFSVMLVANLTACSSEKNVSNSGSELTASEMMELAPVSGGNTGDVKIQSGDIVAEFEIEGYGTIKAKLFPDIAPIGVQNFIELAQDGYYTGKNIHRVIDGFMFQGGSLNGDGTGGDAAYTGSSDSADTTFGIEVSEDARHFYGAVCYANAGGQNTTQFYIVNSKTTDDPAEYDAVVAQLEEERSKYESGSDGYEYYTYYIDTYSNMADKLRNLSDKYKEQGGTPSLDDDYTVFGQVVEGFDVIDSISAVEVTANSSGETSKPVKDIIIKSVSVYNAE